MKTFTVFVREVHVQEIKVEAKDAEDAMQRVARGEGDAVDNSLEYSHTLDRDTWTAEEDPA